MEGIAPSPTVVVMTITAFVIIRHLITKATRVNRGGALAPAIVYAAGLSYGIYLIHPMVIDVLDLWGFHLDPIGHNPAWFVPFVSVVTFVLSAILTIGLQRTRILGWLVP